MVTLVKILVTNYIFHSPWWPKWLQLGSLYLSQSIDGYFNCYPQTKVAKQLKEQQMVMRGHRDKSMVHELNRWAMIIKFRIGFYKAFIYSLSMWKICNQYVMYE